MALIRALAIDIHFIIFIDIACVHGSTNGTNDIPISYKVIPMVPLVIPLVPIVLPMVLFSLPLVLLVPLVSQCYHW